MKNSKKWGKRILEHIIHPFICPKISYCFKCKSMEITDAKMKNIATLIRKKPFLA